MKLFAASRPITSPTLIARRLLPPVQTRRYLQTDTSPPHAYLRPLLNSRAAKEYDKAEELEGVMSLVLDRQETKNALSVRMVNVRIACWTRGKEGR
jgi:methylglutaconyl-CoA hydratase